MGAEPCNYRSLNELAFSQTTHLPVHTNFGSSRRSRGAACSCGTSKSRIVSLYTCSLLHLVSSQTRTSIYEMVTLHFTSLFLASITLNRLCIVLDIMPPPALWLPSIVNVFPAPVAPYAKTVALNPLRTPSMRCFVVLS